MKRIAMLLLNRTNLLILLTFVTIIVLSIMSPYFLTLYNATQILHFMTVVFLISIGQFLVILAGGAGIDLSVGSIISLSGILLGIINVFGLPLLISIIIVLFFGCIMGGINGFVVVKIKMPPLIATLGTLYLYGGLALVISNKGTISGFPENFSFIGQYSLLGIPIKIIFFVIPIYVSVLLIMNRTELGRNIYLIGINAKAAKYAGIEVERIRFFLYVASGFLASLGGILMTSYLMVAKADVGRDLELQSVVIVMLAGTSIFGGIGKIENIIPSTLIITMLATGLQLAQINTVWQMGILGFILIIIMILNNTIDKKIEYFKE